MSVVNASLDVLSLKNISPSDNVLSKIFLLKLNLEQWEIAPSEDSTIPSVLK